MHFTGSPSIDAHVFFRGEDNLRGGEQQLLTFTGHDRVSGTATFTLKKDYANVRYKVMLKGVVSTRTSQGTSTSLQSATHTESFTFVSSTLFEGPKTASQTDARYRAEVPFKFVVQNDDPMSGDTWQSGHPKQMLPSLDSKAIPLHWSKNLTSPQSAMAGYRVTYTIIAAAFVDNKKVAAKIREFSFIPTVAETSATPVEDFPGEYALRASKVLQHGTSQARLGVISDEPQVMSLTNNGNGGWTTVNMLLMLWRETSDYFATKSPPRECRVRASLRSTTFIMPQPAKPAFHTQEVASYNKNIVIREEKSHPQEYYLPLEDWEGHDSESEDEKATPCPEITTTQSHFTFILDPKQLPAPTFHSPLLSRRYALDLTLTFDDDATSTMKLRLPVQIVYAA